MNKNSIIFCLVAVAFMAMICGGSAQNLGCKESKQLCGRCNLLCQCAATKAPALKHLSGLCISSCNKCCQDSMKCTTNALPSSCGGGMSYKPIMECVGTFLKAGK